MTQPTSNSAKSQPTASLGLTHGYCFEGDATYLNAEVIAHDHAAATQEWALQLWASHDLDQAAPGKGVKIAEVSLGSPFGADQTYARVQGMSTALPPAGSTPCRLFIALASGTQGQFDTIHDFAAYPQSETFVQPRLSGAVTHTLAGTSLELKIEAIENPRAADNLSGTLALELWSMNALYQGGEWSGTPVASLVLGTLSGQCQWLDCDYLANAALPEQSGYLTLMLREWTHAGYVTRDYRTLAEPTLVARKTTSKPAKKAAPKAASKVAAATVTETGISVNKASEDELLSIKGLGAAVVRAIIAGRPYAALEELNRVKGMGEKLLAKIKSQLKL